MMMPKNQARPRYWVRLLLNPFFHDRSRGSVIRLRTRMDVFPFNAFSLGKDSIIEDFVTINNGAGDVQIGERSIIGISSVLIGPVKIGDDVMLAQHIVISGLNHSYEDVSLPPSRQKERCEAIIIDNGVWIGANAVITAGVRIGKHSVVGAGSVVTKDIPPYTVVVGNPARPIKFFDVKTNDWKRTKC